MLKTFIKECNELADAGDAIGTVSELMRNLITGPGEVDEVRLATYPEDAPIDGVSEFIFESSLLTIVVVHTPPGYDQPPHDHLMPVVIGVYEGTEVHRFFNRSGGTLEPTAGKAVGPGEVVTLGSAAIHAIAAADDVWCSAVHVYFGSLSSVNRSLFHPETFVEEPMNEERYREFCRQV